MTWDLCSIAWVSLSAPAIIAHSRLCLVSASQRQRGHHWRFTTQNQNWTRWRMVFDACRKYLNDERDHRSLSGFDHRSQYEVEKLQEAGACAKRRRIQPALRRPGYSVRAHGR